MLAIARALVALPLLLVMDEPTEGLAPVIVAEVASVIVVEGGRRFDPAGRAERRVCNKGSRLRSCYEQGAGRPLYRSRDALEK